MLVDWEIKQLNLTNKILDPFNDMQVNPNSYDLTLDGEFYKFPEEHYGQVPIIDPRKDKEIGYTERAESITLMPGNFVLGTTIETVKLPNGIVAILEGKSSFARIGLAVHITGGFIDTGFAGQITLEIKNENNNCGILLRKGDLIGQLIFFRTEKASMPYNRKVSSKYNNQRGPTPSRYFKNEWYS